MISGQKQSRFHLPDPFSKDSAMTTLLLKNDFHDTETLIRIDKPLTARRLQAIRSRLCGVRDCACAQDHLGTRGQVSSTAYRALEQEAFLVVMF